MLWKGISSPLCFIYATFYLLLLSDALSANIDHEGANLLLNKYLPNHPTERFCKLKSIHEDIALGYPGCESKIIQKNYCYGQCSTLFIPSERSGHLACSFCTPTSREDLLIPLQCGNEQRMVDVQIITGCSCQPCRISSNQIPTVEPRWQSNVKRKKKSKRKRHAKNKNIKFQNALNKYKKILERTLLTTNEETERLKRKLKRMLRKRKKSRKDLQKLKNDDRTTLTSSPSKSPVLTLSYMDLIHMSYVPNIQ